MLTICCTHTLGSIKLLSFFNRKNHRSGIVYVATLFFWCYGGEIFYQDIFYIIRKWHLLFFDELQVGLCGSPLRVYLSGFGTNKLGTTTVHVRRYPTTAISLCNVTMSAGNVLFAWFIPELWMYYFITPVTEDDPKPYCGLFSDHRFLSVMTTSSMRENII